MSFGGQIELWPPKPTYTREMAFHACDSCFGYVTHSLPDQMHSAIAIHDGDGDSKGVGWRVADEVKKQLPPDSSECGGPDKESSNSQSTDLSKRNQ